MKTKLYKETVKMPAVCVGPENPLPHFGGVTDIHANEVKIDDTVPEDERAYFGYGKVANILPYRMQDGYTRDKKMTDLEGWVLENEHVKAMFFPQYGGRLWYLKDKKTGKNLVQHNPVVQPANFALRNAWISGGVEWNLGTTGHTVFTMAPMFTGVSKLADGTPVLRMYEWERVREASYQIDAFLPEDSKFLFVRISIRNTKPDTVPMYWWSNIAVDETEDTRILVPADKAFTFSYEGAICKIDVPYTDGIDKSYSTRVGHAMDFFYDIPKGHRKWEAALDGKGEGLVQASTDLLQGRKLFLWGHGVGGKHWQEYLSEPGQAYAEIQAGLANTQMEHLPMPGNANWQWLEAYGMMQADAKIAHGEWDAATAHVEGLLDNMLPKEKLDAMLAALNTDLSAECTRELTGSGWAALELERRGAKCNFEGENACFYAESMTDQQAPWLQLLRTGVFPEFAIDQEPASFLTQKEWVAMLEESINSGKSKHWHALYQLGVMYAAATDNEKSKAAFAESDKLKSNAWAKHGLAVHARAEEDLAKAIDLLMAAVKQHNILPLALECANTIRIAERYADLIAFYKGLPAEMQNFSRMRAMYAYALIHVDAFDEALSILKSGIEVPDMREGEVLLSDVWEKLFLFKLHKEEGAEINEALLERVRRETPVPMELDFRMREMGLTELMGKGH